MTTDRCAVPRRKNPSGVIYLGRPLCDACWQRACAGKLDLREKLDLPREAGEKTR